VRVITTPRPTKTKLERKKPFVEEEQRDFARGLRRTSTDAELQLWRRLRNRTLGPKFRRQVAVGPYVVDFACVEAGLVVEVDGGQHFEDANAAYDLERTRYLESQGLRVLRVTNLDVLTAMDSVLEAIFEALGSPSP